MACKGAGLIARLIQRELRYVPTTCVHDLAGRLVCQKCKKVGKRPAATLLQLMPRQRPPEVDK